MKKIFFAGTTLVLFFTTCKTVKPTEKAVATKPVVDCNNINYSYSFDIKPIFETYCVNCHAEGGEAGYNFTKIPDLKRAAQSGELIGAIKWKRGFSKMPQDADRLDETTINKIECWVNNGMKE
jgi:cytochrome c553